MNSTEDYYQDDKNSHPIKKEEFSEKREADKIEFFTKSKFQKKGKKKKEKMKIFISAKEKEMRRKRKLRFRK